MSGYKLQCKFTEGSLGGVSEAHDSYESALASAHFWDSFGDTRVQVVCDGPRETDVGRIMYPLARSWG